MIPIQLGPGQRCSGVGPPKKRIRSGRLSIPFRPTWTKRRLTTTGGWGRCGHQRTNQPGRATRKRKGVILLNTQRTAKYRGARRTGNGKFSRLVHPCDILRLTATKSQEKLREPRESADPSAGGSRRPGSPSRRRFGKSCSHKDLHDTPQIQ